MQEAHYPSSLILQGNKNTIFILADYISGEVRLLTNPSGTRVSAGERRGGIRVSGCPAWPSAAVLGHTRGLRLRGCSVTLAPQAVPETLFDGVWDRGVQTTACFLPPVPPRHWRSRPPVQWVGRISCVLRIFHLSVRGQNRYSPNYFQSNLFFFFF